MNTTASDLRARNLRTIGLLAALFLLPLVASFWLYYGTGWRPAGTAAHGTLIGPTPLPQVALNDAIGGTADPATFTENWALVYVGDGACPEACQRALYVARQTRLALNQDMSRVKRVFLVTENCCDRAWLEREHAGMVVLDAAHEDAQSLLDAFPRDAREHTLFVVDPLGNLMMRYDARQDPRGLLDDLKRLLKLSHIG